MNDDLFEEMKRQTPTGATTASAKVTGSEAITDWSVEVDPARCKPFPGNGRCGYLFDIRRPVDRELADSIAANGQVTPVLLRVAGDAYEVVAGHRRWCAVSYLNKTGRNLLLRAEVRPLEDGQALAASEAENDARSKLTALQQARQWRWQLEILAGGEQKQLATMLGKSPSVVSRTLALLAVPDAILLLLDDPERVSVHFAEQLAPILADHAQAELVLAKAANLKAGGSRLAGPRLLEALLSTPAEQAAAVRHFGAGRNDRLATVTSKDGVVSLRVKALEDGVSGRERKQLLEQLVAVLREVIVG